MSIRITHHFDCSAVEGRAATLLSALAARPLKAAYAGESAEWRSGPDWLVVQEHEGRYALSLGRVRGSGTVQPLLLLEAAQRLGGRYTLLQEFAAPAGIEAHALDVFEAGSCLWRERVHYAEHGELPPAASAALDLFRLAGRGARFAMTAALERRRQQIREGTEYAVAELRFVLRRQQWAPHAVSMLHGRVRSAPPHRRCELVVEEDTMEAFETDPGLTLCLGSLEIPWSDLHRLRPGSVIELTGFKELDGMLLLEGQDWASVRVCCDGEKLVCRVTGFPALQHLAQAPEETSRQAPRLVDEILASAAAARVSDVRDGPAADSVRRTGSRGVLP